MERKQELQIDPSPFSGDFKTKMNEVVNDEVRKVIKNGGQTVAAAMPMVLFNQQTSEANDNIVLNKRHAWGFGAGMVCALEEAFEKDPDRNTGKKIVSIAAKFGAGYGAGYIISSNVDQYGWSPKEWIKEVEGVSRIIMLSAPAYVLYKETSFANLGDRISSIWNTAVDWLKGKGEARRVKNEQKKQKEEEDKDLQNTLKDYYSNNRTARQKAGEKLKEQGYMCFDGAVLRDVGDKYQRFTIQDGRVHVEDNYKGLVDKTIGSVQDVVKGIFSPHNKRRR